MTELCRMIFFEKFQVGSHACIKSLEYVTLMKLECSSLAFNVFLDVALNRYVSALNPAKEV